ncbi:MAG: hypothetical protein LC130_17120, partial [Bryobacterales bacterium]|nr:hypothetical protein [Bryobacterales bacterium]
HRLLMKSTPAGMNDLVLSIGDAGELYLQNRESFHVEGATRSRGAGNRHQIWHDVELFDIQLALRRAGVVAMWESEPEIRAANDLTTHHYAKDYDAVVTFQSGDRRGRWALEYERTPKWSKEYERIRAALQHEEKVDGFLYLVRSVQAQVPAASLRCARPQILVGLARAFAHNPFHASLINVATNWPAPSTSIREGVMRPARHLLICNAQIEPRLPHRRASNYAASRCWVPTSQSWRVIAIRR